MKKVWITSDCTCDMSEALLNEYDVEVIYFYITTDHGCFKDMDEMTATNVVEYFDNGGKQIATAAPAPKEYTEFFQRILQKHDEIIHIAISSKLSKSYENAVAAAEQFGGRVKVFDSGHLSTGIAHFVIRGVELARENKTTEEILAFFEAMRDKVSTSFIVEDAGYLYRTGRVNKFVKVTCTALKIRPVLGMKNGELKLKTIQIGNYEEAVLRYVRKELKNPAKIKRNRLFITYSTATVKVINKIKKQVNERCSFECVWETRASATITSNSGGNAIGVLYVKE